MTLKIERLGLHGDGIAAEHINRLTERFYLIVRLQFHGLCYPLIKLNLI